MIARACRDFTRPDVLCEVIGVLQEAGDGNSGFDGTPIPMPKLSPIWEIGS